MDEPQVLPAVELSGSPAERLRTIDEAIVRLHRLRETLTGERPAVPPPELHGPYINAPVWPWFAAGWIIGALFALMFLLARGWA